MIRATIFGECECLLALLLLLLTVYRNFMDTYISYAFRIESNILSVFVCVLIPTELKFFTVCYLCCSLTHS